MLLMIGCSAVSKTHSNITLLGNPKKSAQFVLDAAMRLINKTYIKENGKL